MTIKAIDIVEERSDPTKVGSSCRRPPPWTRYVSRERANQADPRHQMHSLDYERALGELLELDDTIRATFKHLERKGILDETLIIVTADHGIFTYPLSDTANRPAGHGFDVTGSVDTKYLRSQTSDSAKCNAVGTYRESGLSQYITHGNLTYSPGSHFPSTWEPRYTLQQGVVAFPDHRESWAVNAEGPRKPTGKDRPEGVQTAGTMPERIPQGVHSLTDVPVFARGPCQELFGGVYNNIDIFFKMAECLGLSEK